MATTTVSDAVVVPQAKGTGLGSEDDNVDAATAALLARHLGGEYIDTSYGQGMAFTRDDANNEIDVSPGMCFIEDDSTSTGGSRGTGGNPQVQSTSSSGYDTEIPANQHYLVIFPTTASVAVTDATQSTIWINITGVTSNNAVELRSSTGGGTTATPSDTFIEVGNGIADDGTGSVTRPNDLNPADRAALDGSAGTDGQVWTSTGSAAQWEAAAGGLTTKVISDTDSPYTTSDEDIIYVDESSAAVTVTLATADATKGNEIEIVNLTGTNTVTVNTEGSETIDPGGESSKAITKAGWNHSFTSGGTNWAAGLTIQNAGGLAYPDSATAADGSIAIGSGATADSGNTSFPPLAIGEGATANTNNSVLIGNGASTGGGINVMAIGNNATGGFNKGVAIGESASANTEAVAIGQDAGSESDDFWEAIGKGADTSASDATAIGHKTTVATANVCRIGRNQLVFGGTQDTIADGDLNNGELTIELDETNNAFRLRGKDSGGVVREATVAW